MSPAAFGVLPTPARQPTVTISRYKRPCPVSVFGIQAAPRVQSVQPGSFSQIGTREAVMATTRLLEAMTWPEAAEAAGGSRPVVIAIGSAEQHGPHLPLNTDVLLPVAVALEAAKQVDLIVAPAVRFGAMSRALSGGGETFPGTLSLRASTLIATIHEVLSALARTGFKRICVQNWHYENAGYLWEACDLTSTRHPDVRMLLLENPFPQLTEAQLAEIFPKGFPGW